MSTICTCLVEFAARSLAAMRPLRLNVWMETDVLKRRNFGPQRMTGAYSGRQIMASSSSWTDMVLPAAGMVEPVPPGVTTRATSSTGGMGTGSTISDPWAGACGHTSKGGCGCTIVVGMLS
jgi:hypothetical protein